MFESIRHLYDRNRTLILITFEAFWLIIFLLERAGGGAGVDIPQFIYVNF